MKHKYHIRRKRRVPSKITSILATAALIATPAPLLADTEYEWEAGEGYHEEEWYDPSDWFNNDEGISYEYDASPYTDRENWTGASTAYDRGDLENTWYDSPDNEQNRMNNRYTWDPVAMEWIVYTVDTDTRTDTAAQNRRDTQTQTAGQRDRGDRTTTVRQDRQDRTGTTAGQDRQDRERTYSVNRDNRQDRTGATSGQDRQDRERTYSANRDNRQDRTTARQDRGSAYQDEAWERDNYVSDSGDRMDRSADTERISGTIDGFRKAEVSTQGRIPESHQLIRVNLEDRDPMIVSLGPDKSLGDLDLQKGDRIQIEGKKMSVNDRDIVKAHKITVAGETHKLKKKGESSAKKSDSSANISGTLQDHRRANIQGRDHLVVRLEMENRDNVLVDLGPDAELGDFDLEEGASIRVSGKRSQVDGRSVLIADKITVDGDRSQIRDRRHQDARNQGNRGATRNQDRGANTGSADR